MKENNIHIVCTRKIKKEWIALAEEKGITIESKDFLQIMPLPQQAFALTLLENEFPLVFTSAHAVYAIKDITFKTKNISAFAIEGNTSETAKSYGFKILGTAPDAKTLSTEIAKHHIKSVLHCTTKNRRDELKEGLQKLNIAYHAIEVYEKKPQPQKVEIFDGVMFFSPSQIDAFLMLNELPEELPAFCVGSTTANHLKKLLHKNILIAEKASEEELIQTILKFYEKKHEQHTFIA